jgi:hypothetical protein
MTIQRGFGVMPPPARALSSRRTDNHTEKQRTPLRRAHSNISVSGRPSFRAKVNAVQQKDHPIKGPAVKQHEPLGVDIVSLAVKVSKPFREFDGYSTDELTDEESETIAQVPEVPAEESRNVKPRRVGFHTDANGEVLRHVSLHPLPLTLRDIKHFWWSRKELKATREEAKSVIGYTVKFCPEYREAAQQLLFKFGGLDPSMKGTAVAKGTRTDEEAVAILVRCKARGLEKPLLARMNIPCPIYRTSVFRLLKAQTRLDQECCCDANERVEVLARQYHDDTQAAVAWARLLADGDTMVARNKFMFRM